jgi:hypothetical protein
MRIKLKYGNKFFNRGLEGVIVKYEDSPQMQGIFPDLKEKYGSSIHIVRFGDTDCLFSEKELEFLGD